MLGAAKTGIAWYYEIYFLKIENRILIQYLGFNSATFFSCFEWDKDRDAKFKLLYEKTTKLRGPTRFKVKVKKKLLW